MRKFGTFYLRHPVIICSNLPANTAVSSRRQA